MKEALSHEHWVIHSGTGVILSTLGPKLLAPLIGKYLFKFDSGINGGARTSTTSVAMVGDVAKSNMTNDMLAGTTQQMFLEY